MCAVKNEGGNNANTDIIRPEAPHTDRVAVVAKKLRDRFDDIPGGLA